MSEADNKTSDENVANIEEDIKYVKEMLEIARVFFKAVKAETNYKDVDDVAFCNAVEHILAEREQKDKRIQELEEQVKTLDEAYTGVIKESKKWFDIAHNSIPKQAVIDLMENETINISGFECIAVEDLEKIIGG